MEIQRQVRKSKTIPLISLIDIVFQLLIYFMLTTSFTRSESLELALPPSQEAAKSVKQDDAQTIHIYVSDTGETFLERKSIGEQDMARELKAMMAVNPERGILVLSAAQVPVKVLVRVMDRIYSAGGKNLSVADWILPKQESNSQGKNTHG